MSRASVQAFVCGHEGCTKLVRCEYQDRAEARQQRERYGNGKYRCIRHSQPNSVLSADNLRREWSGATDQREHGRYIGHQGFLHGPGFKFFAEDFPAGTILRVTAEVVLPVSGRNEVTSPQTADPEPGMSKNLSGDQP